jgi:hypothetical protein
MSRKVTQVNLEKRLNKWKRVLKLTDWDISIKYKPYSELGKDNVTGLVNFCSPEEMTAEIYISNTYYRHEGYKISWNLDSLIIHELIHVVLWEEWDKLAEHIRDNKKLENFEEFVCWHFAKIIKDLFKRK